MSEESLENALKSIHSSLSDAPQLDAEMVVKLRGIVDEINAAIADSEQNQEAEASPKTLSDRLKALIADFEVQHPTLTTNLSLIAERLADMGI